ncbi:MAG: hypothetical protein ACO3ZD_10970, partial [Cyanobium sp.]
RLEFLPPTIRWGVFVLGEAKKEAEPTRNGDHSGGSNQKQAQGERNALPLEKSAKMNGQVTELHVRFRFCHLKLISLQYGDLYHLLSGGGRGGCDPIGKEQ